MNTVYFILGILRTVLWSQGKGDPASSFSLLGRSRYRTRFQASSDDSDSANLPGYEAASSVKKKTKGGSAPAQGDFQPRSQGAFDEVV